MSDINSFADLTEEDFQWIFEMQLLRQKVMDAITADLSKEQDQVWARHIVVSDEAEAQSIVDRLNNGEDFLTVATEVLSGTETTTSVDLGWFGVGTLEVNAEKVVFNLPIGQISEPIQTTSGWEIYQVLGHEVRTLSEADFETLKQTNFQTWLDEQKVAQDVQTFDIWKTRVPASPTIPPTQAT
jgi:foldase protein PrsA